MLLGAVKEKKDASSSFFAARQSRPAAPVNAESRVCDLSGEAVDGINTEPPQVNPLEKLLCQVSSL
jgi:hypothetical protein